MSSVSPFISLPITDITGELLSHQFLGKCASLELKVANCFEAYGGYRAEKECRDLISDFKECTYGMKQERRLRELRMERKRQINSGQRSPENAYAEPPTLDSYQ